MGSCYSARAHPVRHTSQHYPQRGYNYPHAHSHTIRPQPKVVVMNPSPVIVGGVPRRRRTGKVVVKSVECTPGGRTVTRTHYEYGKKWKKSNKGVRFS
ncbi:uncharacterized protein I206_103107 [Kwoniella pini CBS 10737]|uniref:Uncharacterized protein n=1 Tax=Kwoniella pini CBS 10737 TaxID=1296096 RepID=A0AAJ8MP04_9TREE